MSHLEKKVITDLPINPLPTDLSTNLPTASTSGDFIGTFFEGRGVQETLSMSIKNYKK